MRIAVCGGRNYGVPNDPDYSIPLEEVKTAEQANAEVARLNSVLDAYGDVDEIIHGGANGADTLAGEWARAHSVTETVFEAAWREYGKSAGFKRNVQIVANEPDLVIAFPGGKGTAHMRSLTVQAGLPLRVID